MQQIVIYWSSIVSQHVSGIFMPIIRRSDCVPLPIVVCPVVAVVMLESWVERCVWVPRLRRQESEADHSLPSNFEVKNE